MTTDDTGVTHVPRYELLIAINDIAEMIRDIFISRHLLNPISDRQTDATESLIIWTVDVPTEQSGVMTTDDTGVTRVPRYQLLIATYNSWP